MDKLQRVYDRIFEEPTTVKGLNNKMCYLSDLTIVNIGNPKAFRLMKIINNELRQTLKLIRSTNQ